jgi:hypothetical protein
MPECSFGLPKSQTRRLLFVNRGYVSKNSPSRKTHAAGTRDHLEMLQYAWRVLTRRSSVWSAALGCAALAALPGVVAITALAVPTVSLAVTGDIALAASLLPESLKGTASIPVWAAVAGAAIAMVGAYTRLFALGVWASNEDGDPSAAAAWRGSRSAWPSVLLLYLQGYGILVVVAIVLAPALVVATGGGSAAAGVLFALALLVVARTLMRIVLTTAVRAAVLDDLPAHGAWRKAISLVRSRRPDAAAAWAALLGIGVAVWMGGRLVSPVLQDTALTYPAQSSYAYLRESAQVLLAIPLEGFLLALSFGAWTAFYLDVEPEAPRPAGTERRRFFAPTDPWITRALATLVVLVVVVNGVPTAVDRAWADARDDDIARVAEEEISIGEVLDDASIVGSSNTSYRVDAELEDGVLEWTTRVTYRNQTGGDLTSLGMNVYPAAFAGDLEDMPLAQDLLTTDLSGEFRSSATPGDFDVRNVTIDGRAARTDLAGTGLTIQFPSPLSPGRRITATVQLEAQLPHYPERFGVWESITLLGNWIPVVARHEDGEWRFDEYGHIGDPFVADIADYEVTLETDDGAWIAGTGTLTRLEASAPQRRRWHFVADSVRDAAYAVSPGMRALEANVDGMTVRSWYPAEERIRGAANLNTARAVIAFYAETFGDLPFDEIEVVATRGLLGGMEYPGVVFVSDTGNALQGLPLLPDLLRYAGFAEAQRRYVLAHEIAHQWWYAAVGSDQVREPWLDEALAELSTILWLRSVDGDQRAWRMTNLVDEANVESAAISAGVADFSSNRAYTDVIYLSGSALLMQLRELTGAERFTEIMRTYYERFRGRSASIDDFISIVESVGGPDAAALLERHR